MQRAEKVSAMTLMPTFSSFCRSEATGESQSPGAAPAENLTWLLLSNDTGRERDPPSPEEREAAAGTSGVKQALSSSGVYNWTHPQPGTREHQLALAQYSQTGSTFLHSMFSEKNHILLRQTCKLKLKARVYTMLSKTTILQSLA